MTRPSLPRWACSLLLVLGLHAGARAARRNCSTARICSVSVRENVWDPSLFETK